LEKFGKAIIFARDVNTDDFVQPSRQTVHSDPDLSYTTLAARNDAYRNLLFPRTIRDWNSIDTRSGPSLFHSVQLTFPAANVMHPSGSGLSPLLGMYLKYRSTEAIALCGNSVAGDQCWLLVIVKL